MKSAVIIFPGSNCDRDVLSSFESCGLNPQPVWHGDSELPKVDLVAIPGGFSYGDYLRCGSMAAHSPIMREVINYANKGGHVLGICNGFQVLTETRLLPGALMMNAQLRFVCRDVHLRLENADTAFTGSFNANNVVSMPVAHKEGNYFADEDTLKSLEDNGQIAFRYCDSKGEVGMRSNPNGSQRNIAGIFNKNKNILGMMRHPDRAAVMQLGGTDGALIMASLRQALSA